MADYPTVEELREIEAFIGTSEEWMGLVNDAWNHEMGSFKRVGKAYRLATGGWSGNEDIVGSMQINILWAVTWVSSSRGGLYIFTI